MKKQKKYNNKRKWWFKGLKCIMRPFYKKPAFIYLGEKVSHGGVILSNHEGTYAPMAWEIFSKLPIRMWGAHEMNSGLIKLYKYQTRIYYHEKKHWNLHLARLFCLIASPLTNLFYKGLNLISTYHDARLRHTFSESIETIQHGDNIVIYPEVSDKGYLAELEGFHAGFVSFAKICQAKGFDLPVFVSYYRKNDRVYIIDKPIMFSELTSDNPSKQEIAKRLCERCNELGKMEFDADTINKAREY